MATANSKPGDIIVLEVHLVHPASGKYSPMENRQDVFDAVRTATLAGIHVVAAGGNGGADLDGAVYQGIFNRSQRDSGSVLVGATEGISLARAGFSNYGAIIDANGWGRNVTTTGYGNLFYPNGDARQKYSASFSGTSSATPIVTSACADVLSAALQQLGRVLKPTELRALMRQHGTPVPNGKIGPRPDLKKLLAAIGLPRGLGMGTEPTLGGKVTIDLDGRALENYLLFVANSPGLVQLPFERLLLDPARMISAGAGTLNPAGTANFTAVVPNMPVFLFEEFHWQALRFGKGRTDVTSSVVTLITK